MFKRQFTFQSVRGVIAVSVLALGGAISSAAAQSQNDINVPPVPPGIAVPAGHVPFLQGHATGTQDYICLVTHSGFTWKFLGPQATVFESLNGSYSQVATHFLSVNPSEGAARATWQHSADSSLVWAKTVASSTDPNFVQPGAIAWLRLEAAGSQLGTGGGSLLAKTTFIQRVNTSGGLAPATGCSNAKDVGVMALVPYTTDYIFYALDPQ